MANVDWKRLLQSVAPTLATALGGPLAGMAVSAVSQAVLGKTDASETEIATLLARSNDPDVLLKLKQAETEFVARMKQLDIDLEKIASDDRGSARQREIAVKDKTPTILAYVYTIGYFLVLVYILKFGIASDKELVNILIGILSAAEIGIINYYFGSSSGSAKKSDAINQLMNK